MEFRDAYACDCDGVKRDYMRETVRSASARASLDMCESITGTRPIGCPWRAYYSDDVAAVLRAYTFHESGQLREWWGDDPEAWLVDGLRVYHGALSHVRADAAEARRKARQ